MEESKKCRIDVWNHLNLFSANLCLFQSIFPPLPLILFRVTNFKLHFSLEKMTLVVMLMLKDVII